MAIRGPPATAGAGVGDGGALGGGPEDEISEVPARLPGEGPGERRREERDQPEVRLTAHLLVREGRDLPAAVGR